MKSLAYGGVYIAERMGTSRLVKGAHPGRFLGNAERSKFSEHVAIHVRVTTPTSNIAFEAYLMTSEIASIWDMVHAKHKQHVSRIVHSNQSIPSLSVLQNISRSGPLFDCIEDS